jgi:hypothetical protein
MPSKVQPTQAPQNPVICWRESLLPAAGCLAMDSVAMLSSIFTGDDLRRQEDSMAGTGKYGLADQAQCGDARIEPVLYAIL